MSLLHLTTITVLLSAMIVPGAAVAEPTPSGGGYHYKPPWTDYDRFATDHQSPEYYHHHHDQYDRDSHHHQPPPPHEPPTSRHLTPRDVMADVINNLGLSLIEIHHVSNDNNMALSPYGAMCVLVVLLEGLQGDAAREIVQGGRIPADRAAMRVGIRDIHRHLKSYFIPKEGFLTGLTLSKDNVTLTPEYEDILRFYGYSINSFNPDVLKNESVTTTQSATTVSPTTQPTTQIVSTNPPTPTTDKGPTTIIDDSTESAALTLITERITRKIDSFTTTTEASTTPGTTKPPAVSTTSQAEMSTFMMDVSTESMERAESRYSLLNLPTTLMFKSEMPSTTTAAIITTEKILTTTEMPVTVTMSTPVEKINSISTNPAITIEEVTTPFNVAETTETITTQSTVIPLSVDPLTTPVPATIVDQFATTVAPYETDPFFATLPTNFPADPAIYPNNDYGINAYNDPALTASPDYILQSTTDASTTIFPDYGSASDFSTVTTTTATQDQLGLFDDDALVSTLTANATIVRRSTRSVVDFIIAKYYDNYERRRRPLEPPPRVPSIPPYEPRPPLTFLVGGRFREANIDFMTYETVLPFHYLPELDAMALSFPLDTSRYYLLLILPVEVDGLDRVICNFRSRITLKQVIGKLRYTQVRAVIPSFDLKGYVILTPTLQKLGIRKIFEPRQADFTRMTSDRNVYINNVEQAITVTIRNFADPNHLSGTTDKYRDYRPVDFIAAHPFLYFVMDSELHVTLLAGKIVNPLNSRIR